MTKKAEKRQIQILTFIYEQVENRGYPPTVREIGEAVSLSSTSTVHGYLSLLEKNGLLFRDPSKPRAIELTPSGLAKIGMTEDKNSIPLLGVVTAGVPILAVEDAVEYFPSPPELRRARKLPAPSQQHPQGDTAAAHTAGSKLLFFSK